MAWRDYPPTQGLYRVWVVSLWGEWHETLLRAAAHYKVWSELCGEVFVSFVHCDGNINVPDHMPPFPPGPSIGAHRADVFCTMWGAEIDQPLPTVVRAEGEYLHKMQGLRGL